MNTTVPVAPNPSSTNRSVEEDFARLALFAISMRRAPCVKLGMPSQYLPAVLKTVQEAYPDARYRILRDFMNHAQVLLWRVPKEGDE